MAAITAGRNRRTESSKRSREDPNLTSYLVHCGEKSGFYKQVRLASNLECGRV